MRIRSLVACTALVAGLVALPLGGTASADHPNHCTRYVGGDADTPKVPLPAQVAVIEVPTPAATFYLEVRQVATEESTWSIWVHEETNGRAGLQRGGSDGREGRLGLALAVIEGTAVTFVDPCKGSTNPDQVVF